MNRREFIKASVPAVALPAIAITCKYEDDEKGEKGTSVDPTNGQHGWPYRVYCYERGQGEWTFSQNVKGSFAHQREYMTFDEEDACIGTKHKYYGFMYDGILHFQTFDDATKFVWDHSSEKDDANIMDSIYDVYRESNDGGTEIQVAHYWFNGDTGRQVHWEQDGFNTDWNKVEFG